MLSPSRKKSNHFTRGGQVTFHAIRMFFQVNNVLIKYIGWGVLLLTLGLSYYTAPQHAFWGEFYYWRNYLYAKLGKPVDSSVVTLWEGERYTDTLASQLEILSSPKFTPPFGTTLKSTSLSHCSLVSSCSISHCVFSMTKARNKVKIFIFVAFN